MVTLRPCRTTYDGFHTDTDKCISAVKIRVIIIGPDAEGCDEDIGEYAQTEPSTYDSSSMILNVKFGKAECGEQRHGRYHLHSLCRATNALLPGFELLCPMTVFD